MWIKIEILKRKWYIKNEIKKKILSLKKNNKLKKIQKELINFKKVKFSFFSNKTRFCNKCLLSGRNHNVFNKFRLSRFFLRTNLKIKNAPLLKKS